MKQTGVQQQNSLGHKHTELGRFFGSICAAMAQVVVGHPFDTLKTHFQNRSSTRGLFTMSSLYKGFRFPVCSATCNNIVGFKVYFMAFSAAGEFSDSCVWRSCFSGAISGMAVTPFMFLLDGSKIRAQVASQSLGFCSTIWSMRYRKGLFSTLMRQTLGMGAYYTTYNVLKQNYNLSTPLAGGCAGLCNWTLTYPIDVLRTRQIANNISICKALCLGPLWGFGYVPCVIRAVLVNSALFWVYESTAAALS